MISSEKSEGFGQKSEALGQKSEALGQKSEALGQNRTQHSPKSLYSLPK